MPGASEPDGGIVKMGPNAVEVTYRKHRAARPYRNVTIPSKRERTYAPGMSNPPTRVSLPAGYHRDTLRRVILATSALAIAATVLVGATAAAGVSVRAQWSGTASASVSGPLAWHHVKTVSAPSKRNWFGMAYDAKDNYTVLYGGYNGVSGTLFSDTWTFVSGKWTALNLAIHPSGDSGLILVYDPALKGVVAFGGEAPFGSAYYNDTWLFHHGTWTQLFPTVSPPPRSQYAMAYDAADSEIVMFGGYDGSAHELSDTWVFNGATWAKVTTSTSPDGRQFASMVYDSLTHHTLLVAGTNSTIGSTIDTWAFHAGTWKLIVGSNTQSRVHTPVSAMGNGTPMFFGGQLNFTSSTLFNSSFEFFGGSWHMVTFAHAPSPRENGGLVYDAKDGHMLDFGGGTYPVYWNQTFSLV
jgi:hypothetical protein